MKAIAPLLSHTIIFGLGVLLLIIVVTTMNSIIKDYQDFVGTNEINQVCMNMKQAIEKIYWPEEYQSQTNTTYGKIVAELPEKIAMMSYRVKFVNNSFYLETLTEPFLNGTCKLGFNVTYNGSTAGGRTEFSWIRYIDGREMINVRKI